MRVQDIIIGEYYRLKDTPNYSWIKPLEILKPKQAPNTNNYIIVKCEHTVDKNDTFGFIKYYRPNIIIKPK